MTLQPSEEREGPFKRCTMATARMMAVVIALSFLTHLSWNLFAPGLFDLPRVRMNQALGLVVFGGVAAFVVRHGVKGGRNG